VILVDSGVWIDYLRGAPTPQVNRLDSLLGVEPVAVGDLGLAKVLQGCDSDADFNRVKDLLDSLFLVELGGREIAIQTARNFRTLRSLGVTIRQTIDTIIATRCIADDLALLYRDKDFDPFKEHLGLRSAMVAA
jgi:predicted nucleic acid-binding protein